MRLIDSSVYSGVGGGVVSAQYFLESFGLIENGVKNQKRVDAVSSNVVAVLQAGAFFGALLSAPVSCEYRALRPIALNFPPPAWTETVLPILPSFPFIVWTFFGSTCHHGNLPSAPNITFHIIPCSWVFERIHILMLPILLPFHHVSFAN